MVLTEELQFCQNSDIKLIISDIPPLPFLLGNKMDIPSVGISNFNWYDIYSHLHIEEEHKDLLSAVEKISSYYELADLFLELPFATSNELLKKRYQFH